MRPALVGVIGLLAGAPAAAQEPPVRDSGNVPVITDLWRALRDPSRATWARPLASAIVPGTGQLLGGRERGALYLVAEAFLLTRSLALNAEGRRERDRYRELAMVVARAPFAPALNDTVFEYFEQMGRYVESGAFDTDPGPALVPPTDERTYNGQIWALARRTFFVDPNVTPAPDSPEYQRALAFYSSRAIGPNFQWSWRNAGLEQDLYRQTIRQSDRAFRHASQGLGLLLANHLLSAVDAAITERLARRGGPRVQTGLDRHLSFIASISFSF
jgi:hypothetical protein